MGRLNGSTRIRILERDHYTCVYCGRKRPDVVLEVDHVVPRSKGGNDEGTNLVTACRDCNNGKRAGLIALPDYVVPVPLLSERERRIQHVHAIERDYVDRIYAGTRDEPINDQVGLDGTWRPCGRCNHVPDDQRLIFVWYDRRSGGSYWCMDCAGTYPA